MSLTKNTFSRVVVRPLTMAMFLGSLQKNSLIDYPGKWSCVYFVFGCNFHCPYCQNPDLVTGNLSHQLPIDKQGFYDFLEKRKGFLDGVVISGGEPTLRKDLAELCGTVKQMGYPVKLDTNGSQPLVIEDLIQEGLVDYIAMDIKADLVGYAATIAEDFNPDSILSSIQIIMESAKDYEFRTTCVRPLVDAGVIDRITQLVQGAKRYVLQGFHKTQVLDPDFFAALEPGYAQDEMMAFQSIAEPRVGSCSIR